MCFHENPVDTESAGAAARAGNPNTKSREIRQLAGDLVAKLASARRTVAVAESCTGGLLGGAITGAPGASEVFWGGVIAYDDEAKSRLLGVERGLIERSGAVSEEVAIAMARGVRERSGATWGIAVTGIAGPGGGTPTKPIGGVWIALDGPGAGASLYRFEGDRREVRRAAVVSALATLMERVSEPD